MWSALEPDRLGPGLSDALQDAENEFWLSPLSTWELLVLVDKGRIVLDLDPVVWLRRALRTLPLKEAPLTHDVAIRSHGLPLEHHDPVDRLLVATALAYDLTLATADERLLRSGACPVKGNT